MCRPRLFFCSALECTHSFKPTSTSCQLFICGRCRPPRPVLSLRSQACKARGSASRCQVQTSAVDVAARLRRSGSGSRRAFARWLLRMHRQGPAKTSPDDGTGRIVVAHAWLHRAHLQDWPQPSGFVRQVTPGNAMGLDLLLELVQAPDAARLAEAHEGLDNAARTQPGATWLTTGATDLDGFVALQNEGEPILLQQKDSLAGTRTIRRPRGHVLRRHGEREGRQMCLSGPRSGRVLGGRHVADTRRKCAVRLPAFIQYRLRPSIHTRQHRTCRPTLFCGLLGQGPTYMARLASYLFAEDSGLAARSLSQIAGVKCSGVNKPPRR